MTTRLPYRVIYGDTDQSGVAYHSNHLRWFEAARCEYLRQRGMGYGVMNARGTLFPVVEVSCRYHRPALFEDQIEIEVRVGQVRGASLRFDYRIERGAELLAEGWTLHACTDPAGKAKRIPPDIRATVAD